MRAAIVFALAFVGFTVADTWTVEDTCDAAVVVKNCLASQGARVATCTANDWACLCTEYKNVAQCYINCPLDKNLAAVESSVTAYCNAASAANTSTTSKAVSGTPTASAPPVSGSSHSTTTPKADSPSSTATSSAPGASGSSGAAFAAAPAGIFGALPGVLALAGAFL